MAHEKTIINRVSIHPITIKVGMALKVWSPKRQAMVLAKITTIDAEYGEVVYEDENGAFAMATTTELASPGFARFPDLYE